MASVAELLFERGQRAAQAIREQGAIKAQALGTLGQIGAGAVQAYGQAKDADAKAADEARKQALFANGMPDPETLMAEFGPEKASAIIGGYKALEDWNAGKTKNAREEAGRVAMGLMVLPETVRQSAWPQVKQLAIKAGFPVQDLPDVATPEFLQSVVTMATGQAPAKPEAPKTRQITVKNADGSETIQVVEDKPGLSFTSAPTPEKVKFGAPTPAMVGGKRVFIQMGSDGKPYDMQGRAVDITPTPIEPTQTPRDERIVQVMGEGGVPVWVRESEAVGKPAAQAPRAVTGAERQALSFYNRAKDAVDTLVTPNDAGQTLEDRIAAQSLLAQQQGQRAWNFLQTQDQQLYRQAQRAFTEARLRKESGAAIPESEFANDAKTYFVQPGDDKKTVEQKRQKRAKLLEGLGYSAGKAYEEFYGEPMKKNDKPADLIYDPKTGTLKKAGG